MQRSWRRRRVATLFCVAAPALVAGCAAPAPEDADRAELLRLHAIVLDSHRAGDVDAWLAIEGEPYVSANGGTVTYPTAEERRASRAPYLASTTFDVYRDLREPIVEVSADGTLGWVIAEVEVVGIRSGGGAGADSIDQVWAWIELYRKIDGEWKLVGNVSNRRP